MMRLSIVSVISGESAEGATVGRKAPGFARVNVRFPQGRHILVTKKQNFTHSTFK
jgi:hypothetical protein